MVTEICGKNTQIYCCSCFQQVTLLIYFTLSHLSTCPGTRDTKSRLLDGFMFLKELCKITSAHGLWMCQTMPQEETRWDLTLGAETGTQISPVDSQGPTGLWAYFSEGYCNFLSLFGQMIGGKRSWTKRNEWPVRLRVEKLWWLLLDWPYPEFTGVRAWRLPSLVSRVPESWVRVPLQNIFGEKPGEL